jgi:hypothetical protein
LLVVEALRMAWRAADLPEQAMTRSWWHALAELAIGGAGGALHLPGNVLAQGEADRLVLARQGRPA